MDYIWFDYLIPINIRAPLDIVPLIFAPLISAHPQISHPFVVVCINIFVPSISMYHSLHAFHPRVFTPSHRSNMNQGFCINTGLASVDSIVEANKIIVRCVDTEFSDHLLELSSMRVYGWLAAFTLQQLLHRLFLVTLYRVLFLIVFSSMPFHASLSWYWHNVSDKMLPVLMFEIFDDTCVTWL